MKPSEIWSSSTVFVETGIRDGRLGASLLQAGLSNYLGVSSDPVRLARIQSHYPKLAPHVTHAPWRRCVEMNNAEVLILSGFTVLYLWRYRAVRHVESVAWSADWNLLNLI